jgi:WD40 repeat protein
MTDITLDESGREANIDEAIAEFEKARDAELSPRPEDWLRRYPDFEAELRQYFEDLGIIVLPRSFGRFELRERLGGGGQGEIFLAHQDSPRCDVALKLIRAGQFASADEVRRFRDEADAVAALHHPNIVTIHEFGQHDGWWYFSMRLMTGGSLADRLDRCPEDPRASARLVATIARAVQHVHQRRVVHRDLKPSNVLFDEEGRPYISDFGLARRLTTGEGTTVTATGGPAGTVPYMAPEVASCRSDAVTTAIDVYGLGAILYATLTGRAPFKGKSVVEVLRLVCEDDPKPPRALNPLVDRDLETICLTCLDKDRNKRYASAEALAEDLERWLAGEPVKVRPPGTAEKAFKWVRRHPALAIASASAMVIGVLGFAFILREWQAARRASELATAIAEEKSKAASELAVAAKLAAADAYFNEIGTVLLMLTARDVGAAVEKLNQCAPYLRGWEWDYLMACRYRRAPLSLRPEEVYDGAGSNGVAFSFDGRYLASASNDKQVKLWDLSTTSPSPLPALSGHTDIVRSVAFSPRDHLLATASWDATIRIWDIDTATCLHEVPAHSKYAIGVAFSPDGATLASSGSDGAVRLWDVATGKQKSELGAHARQAMCVAFSHDGKYLASASDDGGLWLWDLATGERTEFPSVGCSIRSLAFRFDDARIVGAGMDRALHVWDVAERGESVPPFRGHNGNVRCAAFSPDGTRIVSVGSDRAVRLWEAATGREVLALRGHKDTVRGVAFSPDGKRIASSDDEGCVLIWDSTPTGAQWEALNVVQLEEGVRFGAFSQDGAWLATASFRDEVSIHVRDVVSGRELLTLPGQPGSNHDVAFSPDRVLLASAGDRGTFQVWDLPNHKPIPWKDPDPRAPDTVACCVAFSPADDRLVVAWDDSIISVYDRDGTGAFRATFDFEVNQGAPQTLRFSEDGRYLASGGEDGSIRVFDLKEKRLGAWGFEGHDRHVASLAFSPDGGTLASASFDGTVRLWDVQTGLQHGPTLTCPSAQASVAFSPDSRYLVAAGEDGAIRIWLVADLAGAKTDDEAEPRRTLYGHTSLVWALSFSPKGDRLFSASDDRTVRTWDPTCW